MIPIIIIKTRFGGYLVKSHNPTQYETDVLFAGGAQECVHFIARYMAGTIQEDNK
jgi:hypothetical protein